MSDPRPSDLGILEAMEACRPGSDDLADPAMVLLASAMLSRPELEDRFARLQKVDSVLAGAIQDVPVPPGLGLRLLVSVAPRILDQPRSRRKLFGWAAAGVVAVAAACLAVCCFLPGSDRPVRSPMSILEESLAFFEADAAPGAAKLSAAEPPAAFPFSRFVRPSAAVGWRPVTGLMDKDGVAYELAGPTGARAVLFVFRQTVDGLGGEPPRRPMHGTGNCAGSVWQEGALLYVLVVRGDAGAYQEYLAQPERELAHAAADNSGDSA